MILLYIAAFIISIPLCVFLSCKSYTIIRNNLSKNSRPTGKPAEILCFVCGKNTGLLLQNNGKLFHEDCLQNVIKDPHSYSTVTIANSISVLNSLTEIAKLRRESLDEITNKFNEFKFEKVFIADRSASELLKEISYIHENKSAEKFNFSPVTRASEDQSSGEGTSW